MTTQTSPSSSKLCELCEENTSKYCCPRCEVLYCSLDCYKSEKHLSCSETFYRDCVNEELASLNADDESKQKMLDILKKMRHEDDDGFDNLEHAVDEEIEEYDSDDNDNLDLEDRIKGLDLGDADAIWDVLTEDERNEFEALLNQGDVGSIVPHWQAWWMYSKDARLVQDVDDKEEEEALKNCPKFVDVPEFSSLTNVQPSPTIRYNITNVLASYAFITRYFNGELDPVEGATYMMTVCANLDSNTNFEEAATSVESVKQKCLQSQLIQTDEASLEIMKRDTFFLLQGPSEENKLHYCRAALSDVHKLLSRARSALKLLKPADELPKLDNKPTKLPPLDEKPTKPSKTGDEDLELPTNDNKGAFSKKFPDHKGDHLPTLDASKLKKCIKKSQLIQTDEASLEIMKRDTFFLLQGPSKENKLHYCRAALSDVHKLSSRARSALKLLKPADELPKLDNKPTKLPPLDEKPTKPSKTGDEDLELPTKDSKGAFSKKFPDHKGDHLPTLDASKLKKCIKKVEFYLSFVESCGMDFE